MSNLAAFNRPGLVNIEWVLAGEARREAAALARHDALWEAAHAEYLAGENPEWPVPPVAEVPFALPFAPSTKGKRKHGKARK